MSACPTCGHTVDDALVHSTPIHEPPAPYIDPWRLDLAELVGLIRRVVLDDMRHRNPNTTAAAKRAAAQLRRAA